MRSLISLDFRTCGELPQADHGLRLQKIWFAGLRGLRVTEEISPGPHLVRRLAALCVEDLSADRSGVNVLDLLLARALLEVEIEARENLAIRKAPELIG